MIKNYENLLDVEEENKLEIDHVINTLKAIYRYKRSDTGSAGARVLAEFKGISGALGAKYLARQDAEVLLIVGCTPEATQQLRVMQRLFKKLKRVMVYDPILFENASWFIKTFRGRKSSIEYLPIENLEGAVKKSDIIIIDGSLASPMIMKKWIKKGTHINCIHGSWSKVQHLDSFVLPEAKMVTDSMEWSRNSSVFGHAIKDDLIVPKDIICNIEDVILGNIIIRTTPEDITIYVSTGRGLEDVAAVYLAMQNGIC